MDVDQRTAIDWKTLNSILRENFKYAVCNQTPPSETRKLQHLFDMIAEIMEVAMKTKVGVHFLLTGSVREGVTISSFLRDNIDECDVMFSFKSLKIKAHEQWNMLIDVPSAPGHVKVAVPDHNELSKYTSVDTSLGVACALKEVTTAEGQTRYYLLAQPDANHPRAPFDMGCDIGDFPERITDDSSALYEFFWDFFFGSQGFHEPTTKRSGPAFTRCMGATKEGLDRLERGKKELAINAPTILTNALGRLLSKTCKDKNDSESKGNGHDELSASLKDVIFTFTKTSDRQSIGKTKEKKTRLLSTKDLRNENLKTGVANLFSQAVDIITKDSHDKEKFILGADVLSRGLFGKPFPFLDNSLHSSHDSSCPCMTSKEQNGETNAFVSIPTNAGKKVQMEEIMDEQVEDTAVMKDGKRADYIYLRYRHYYSKQ